MEPTRDGNLLVLGRGYLMKTTWSGVTIWQAQPRAYHHGFAQRDDGIIYAMAQRRRVITLCRREDPILDDEIIEISHNGETLRSISMLDLLGPKEIPPAIIEYNARSSGGADRTRRDPELEEVPRVDNPFDVFHLNAIAIVPCDIGIARAGGLLVCLRTLDRVLVVSLDPVAVVWRWDEGRQVLDRPHAPQVLPNGDLLIFDNGWARGHSRLLEVDPRRGKIVWQYVADPPESFFTRRGGMAQVLPNGNLLVTQSDAGRLFEITRDGETVWDLWNPVFAQNREGQKPQRRTINRAWRWFAHDIPEGGGPPRNVFNEAHAVRDGWSN